MVNYLIKFAKASLADPAITATPKNMNIEQLFGNIVNLLSIIAGMLAFIYLVYSGILYLTAAGNADNAKKGQQGIVNAIIGIVVIVAAWTIISVTINTINNKVIN